MTKINSEVFPLKIDWVNSAYFTIFESSIHKGKYTGMLSYQTERKRELKQLSDCAVSLPEMRDIILKVASQMSCIVNKPS